MICGYIILSCESARLLFSVYCHCFQLPSSPPSLTPNPYSCLQGSKKVDLLIYFSALLGKCHLLIMLYSQC